MQQTDILNEFKKDKNKILPTKHFVNKFRGWYYSHAEKHISELLYRMVQNGKLERVSKGRYKLISYIAKKDQANKDQLNIF